ncbi:hypothetical protein TSAR_010325 [Trichomalopsis sarcophagae]|uniref:Uncharacterized protein n=1 Tax=Trichomalopsis sarcophagae TaxID=543379 RepID=A0A232EKV9_9HYME|nr:hypothetical protein TSAR_010325 [Trichomalopsis sarcophagae]
MYNEETDDYFSKQINLENVDILEQTGKDKAKKEKSIQRIVLPNIITKDQVYQMINELNDDQKDIVMHKKRKIIRYYGYKVETDPINYYREHVLLFLPFTNKESEIEKTNYEKLFYDNFSTIEKNKSQYCIIKDNCLENALKDAENVQWRN